MTSAAMARGREDVPTRRREGAYRGAGDREQRAHNAALHGTTTTTTGGAGTSPPGGNRVGIFRPPSRSPSNSPRERLGTMSAMTNATNTTNDGNDDECVELFVATTTRRRPPPRSPREQSPTSPHAPSTPDTVRRHNRSSTMLGDLYMMNALGIGYGDVDAVVSSPTPLSNNIFYS